MQFILLDYRSDYIGLAYSEISSGGDNVVEAGNYVGTSSRIRWIRRLKNIFRTHKEGVLFLDGDKSNFGHTDIDFKKMENFLETDFWTTPLKVQNFPSI